MRRFVLVLCSTIAGLVLLLGFKTSATTTSASKAPTAITPATSGSTGSSGTSSSGTSSSGTSSSGTAGSSSSTSKTVTGDSVDTRYGPVQVQITVVNGKITAANAVVYPQEDPRDQEINSSAIPALNSEAVAADSAQIDNVSGATYTSDGYISSLQSALDKGKS